MTKRANQAQAAEETDGGSDDGKGDGRLNDPLTHQDVETPRVPFQSDPPVDE